MREGDFVMSIAIGPATPDDLMRIEGKAELIDGRIVHQMATGRLPSRVAVRIFRSLDDHADATGLGEAYTDNIGYIVPMLTSGRESFSPNASFFAGPFPANEMKFLEGPPTFAVEVRSEHDYGPAAEIEMAAKRADYFEAGTAVVWDVDPIGEVVRKYRDEDLARPETFTRGQSAEAEPAVPSWRMGVNAILG